MDIRPTISAPFRFWCAVAIALGLSLIAHALALLFVPSWITAFSDPPSASFDARLVAVSPAEPALAASTTTPPPKSPPKKAQAVSRASAVRRSSALVAPLLSPLASVTPIETPLPLPDLPSANLPPTDSTALSLSETPEPTPITAQPNLSVPPSSAASTAAEEALAPAFPEKIDVTYRLFSSLTDGVATYTWSREGSAYRIDSSLQATGVFASFFVGTLRQSSRGDITATGLRPSFFSIQRGDAEPETAEFNHEQGKVTLKRRNNVRTLPLAPQLQDTQSFLFQLAYDMPRVRKPEDNLDLAVTNARKLYRYRFKQLGTETLNLSFGKVETMHLRSEAADPEDIYEVWLAPQYYFLPVKLKYFMGRFPVEQIAASLSMRG